MPLQADGDRSDDEVGGEVARRAQRDRQQLARRAQDVPAQAGDNGGRDGSAEDADTDVETLGCGSLAVGEL